MTRAHKRHPKLFLRPNFKGERLWATVSGPLDNSDDGTVKRVGLDIPAADHEFIQRYAAYRNAITAAAGKRLKRAWTTKGVAESMVADGCTVLRSQLAEMLKAMGELPKADDTEAMDRYVKRVLAWDKRQQGSK